MRGCYSNFHVHDRDEDQVLAAVRFAKLDPTLIGPRQGDWVALFPKSTDDCDPEVLNKMGRTLSRTLDTPIFSAMVYQSEVLFFTVFDSGKISIEYDSFPEYTNHLSKKYFNKFDGSPDRLIRLCPEGVEIDELKSVLKRRPIREIQREIEEEEGLDRVDMHFMLNMKQYRDRLKDKIVYTRPQDRLADLARVMGLYDEQWSYSGMLKRYRSDGAVNGYLHFRK